LNTFKDEDLTVAGGTLVPSIQIGSPLSLVGGTSTLTTGDDPITTTSFSKIGVATVTDTGAEVVIDTGITVAELAAFIGTTGTEYVSFNYDITSLTDATTTAIVITDETATNPVNLSALSAAITSAGNKINTQVTLDASAATAATATFIDAGADNDLTLESELTIVSAGSGFTTGQVTITDDAATPVSTTALFTDANNDGNIDAGEMGNPAATGTGFSTVVSGTTITQPLSGTVVVTFTSSNSAIAVGDQFAADFFSFGGSVNNAIYRVEMEETGDNTATFEGTAEYVMLNQINFDQAATYNGVNACFSSNHLCSFKKCSCHCPN
jgi:hypothetical protein